MLIPDKSMKFGRLNLRIFIVSYFKSVKISSLDEFMMINLRKNRENSDNKSLK